MASSTLISLFKEQLENESSSLGSIYDLQKRGDLLTWWYFINLLGLDATEVEQVVCDGGNDLGIDAIRIDEENFVHIYQFKNPVAIDSAFPEGDVDKVISGLHLILARDYGNIANEDLKGRIQEIYKIVANGYRLHLVTSGGKLPDTAEAKLNSFVGQLKIPSEEFFFWDCQDISFLQDTFYQKTLPTVQNPIEFELQQSPYQVRASNHDCYIFHTSGSYLASLYAQYGEQLLQQNIRVFEGDKGTNASILKTCTGEDSSNFLHFNNGVTFLTETAQWDGFTRKLTMQRAQIVNGGQTVRVLHKALSTRSLRADVLVPVRIITSQGDKEFGSNVAVNLNNQNRIQPSYLRSNDPSIIQLSNSLLSIGWYLERRDNEVKLMSEDERREIESRIGGSLQDHVIKLKDGSQAYVSTYMRQPELAKKNPKLIFLGAQDGGYFERIFNSELTAERFVAAQQLSWQVGGFVKSFMTRKRRKNRVSDWREDYSTLLGTTFVQKHADSIDQVIPQSAVFLSAIVYEVEVMIKGQSIDEVVSQLNAGDVELLIFYLDLLISFASSDPDYSESWPTLLKSQSFYDRFSSFLKGRLSVE